MNEMRNLMAEMHFDKEERKKINALLKERGIRRKGDVFNLINQGGTRKEVFDLIHELTLEVEANKKPVIELEDQPRPFTIFGREIIAQNAVDDMEAIMRLPHVIEGALMPDAHRVKEAHVPVGGVVLSEAILPDVVGSDIACSVFLTTTNMRVDADWFDENLKSIRHVLRNYAYFGQEINPDPVIHDFAFYTDGVKLESDLGKRVWDSIKNTARTQFGTSGDGNHFVEIGVSNVQEGRSGGWMRGSENYLAILSHFGSRAVGSTIARAFSEFANDQYEMPKGMNDAPLFIDTPEGRDYWNLMQFAGQFAEEGHKWLHQWLLSQLGERVDLNYSKTGNVYSKHNFAWETSDGYLHRKGSTPASMGEFGVIPATMGHQTKVVMGLGNEASLESASHGAGRTHSRGRALQEFGGDDTAEYLLRNFGVHLVGGGADEDPRAYKSIEEVMVHQDSCVGEIGGFNPKVVRMADPRFFSKRGRK